LGLSRYSLELLRASRGVLEPSRGIVEGMNQDRIQFTIV